MNTKQFLKPSLFCVCAIFAAVSVITCGGTGETVIVGQSSGGSSTSSASNTTGSSTSSTGNTGSNGTTSSTTSGSTTGTSTGSTGSGGVPTGTVRLASGTINSVVGQLVNAVGASSSPQTISLIEKGGATETIPNVVTGETMAAGTSVVLLRQGSQPIAATFTDPSNLFYADSGVTNIFLPIDSTGKTLTGYMKNAGDDIFLFNTKSPLMIGSVTVNEVTMRLSISSNGSALGGNPLGFPESFYVDLPLAGQSLSLGDGYVIYDPGFSLQSFAFTADSATGNYATFSGSLQANASAIFKFKPDSVTPLSNGTYSQLIINTGS